jgi:hypothetical protein
MAQAICAWSDCSSATLSNHRPPYLIITLFYSLSLIGPFYPSSYLLLPSFYPRQRGQVPSISRSSAPSTPLLTFFYPRSTLKLTTTKEGRGKREEGRGKSFMMEDGKREEGRILRCKMVEGRRKMEDGRRYFPSDSSFIFLHLATRILTSSSQSE